MSFTTKAWKNSPTETTPLSAEAMIDLETRLSGYTDALAPYVNVKDPTYGAKGNGSTDDKAAIQKAINALSATGGTVYFPPGVYLCSGELTVPAAVYLVGSGMSDVGSGLGSSLKKSANGVLVSMSGTSTEAHHKYGGIRDLQLEGNSKTGALLKAYFADDLTFERVHFSNNKGRALDAIELWDSRFDNIMCSNCGGTSGTEPAFHLRSTTESSPKSSDSTNQVYIRNVRIESWRDGGIWIESGGEPYNGPLGIFLDNIKLESYFLRGPALVVGNSCKDIHVRNSYIAMMDFEAGFSTPVNAIQWEAAERNSIENVEIANGGVETVENGLYLWGNQTRVIDVEPAYGTDPSVAHMNIAGGINNHLEGNSLPLIEVASATEMELPTDGLIKVTGTTTIEEIAPISAGKVVILLFTGSIEITNNFNIKLPNSITKLAAHNCLSLVSDGTNFYGTGESKNL